MRSICQDAAAATDALPERRKRTAIVFKPTAPKRKEDAVAEGPAAGRDGPAHKRKVEDLLKPLSHRVRAAQ